MEKEYQDKIGKDLKLLNITIPYELAKEILETESSFIIVCPYDKGFIQYITDFSYYNEFGFPDTDCHVDYFIEEMCNRYIKKYTKREIKRNKNNWRNILRRVNEIHKNNKKDG